MGFGGKGLDRVIKNAYNKFVKFYDSLLKHMNKEEILDMLKMAIKDVETDQLDVIK